MVFVSAAVTFFEGPLMNIIVCCDIRVIPSFVGRRRCSSTLLQPIGERLAAGQPPIWCIGRRPNGSFFSVDFVLSTNKYANNSWTMQLTNPEWMDWSWVVGASMGEGLGLAIHRQCRRHVFEILCDKCGHCGCGKCSIVIVSAFCWRSYTTCASSPIQSTTWGWFWAHWPRLLKGVGYVFAVYR